MTALAPTLEAFFTERLIGQRQASPHTVAAYRDAWRLLLRFAQHASASSPPSWTWPTSTPPLIGAFLDHLETERHNSVRTRNARLAAIRSFFRFAALRHPEHAALIARVLAIPTKRYDRAVVSFLTEPEVDAVLASPDRATWTGRRDHALLDVALQTGLRVSELTGLRNQDVELGAGAHVRCRGKGRKERCTPLTATDRVGAAGLDARTRRRPRRPAVPHPPRHPPQPRRGRGPRRQARRHRHRAMPVASRQDVDTPRPAPLLRHGTAARRGRPLRHRAVARPRAGRDHQPIYLHADLTIKEQALARTTPLTQRRAATGHPTTSSPSSTASDYAAQQTPIPLPGTGPPEQETHNSQPA